MPRTIAFDIELADIFDLAPGEDLASRGPFRIACAAAACDAGSLRHWFCRSPDGCPGGHLDVDTVREMLGHLRTLQLAGDRLVAWNGLSFDLLWLGHAADDIPLAREIALDLFDPMFQFFVRRGFPVSLAAVAEAMGVEERKSMGGADAPKRWAAGAHQEVLDYVAGDCRITAAVAAAITRERRVRWRTQKGTVSSEPLPELLPVKALLDAPLPDTSWMTTPLPRSKFTAWLDR